jgi:hypothetical protein
MITVQSSYSGKEYSMEIKGFYTFLVLYLIFWPVSRGSADTFSPGGSPGPPILVGHITHVEGQLLRYVPEEQDWVATVKDAPFGLNDTLYTTSNSRAEIILPNRNWIRINGRTQIQLIAARNDLTEVDAFSGTARFYHQGTQGTIKTFTPFGYVLAPAGAVFDLLVEEDSVEVSAIRGDLEFVQTGSLNKYRVKAGGLSLIADSRQAVTGPGAIDSRWKSWNAERDQSYARFQDRPTESAGYLPPNLEYQAPVLDENGRWERVYYQGDFYHFWRPVYVAAGWGPFTTGRWTVWYDDPCWIPAEPFGYLTHHYGNWILVRGVWYWAPPVVRVQVHPFPLFPVPLAWYPGRVAWIHHGPYIGWVPLAPHEPYYGHRPWGPRVVVIDKNHQANSSINRYQYLGNAVVVPQNNFFSVNNYHPHKLGHITRETILKDYRPVPAINQQVVTQYGALREKHHFTNVPVQEKPRLSSLERIRLNQDRIQETERLRSGSTPPAIPFTGDSTPKGEKPGGPRISKPPAGSRNLNHPETFRREPPSPRVIKEAPAFEEKSSGSQTGDQSPHRAVPSRTKTREIESTTPPEPKPGLKKRESPPSHEPSGLPEVRGRELQEEQSGVRKKHPAGDSERFENEGRSQGEEPRMKPSEDAGKSGRGKQGGK